MGGARPVRVTAERFGEVMALAPLVREMTDEMGDEMAVGRAKVDRFGVDGAGVVNMSTLDRDSGMQASEKRDLGPLFAR